MDELEIVLQRRRYDAAARWRCDEAATLRARRRVPDKAFVCGAVSLSVTQLVILGAATTTTTSSRAHAAARSATRRRHHNAGATSSVPPPSPVLREHAAPVVSGAAVAAQVGGIHLHDGSILLTKKSAMRDLRGDGGI